MIEGLSTENKIQFDSDAEEFLAHHKDEVLGILEDPAERELVERFSPHAATTLSADTEKQLADILERFETKIFEYEKPDAEPDAKRVLLTSDNPGSWSAIKPLIEALEQDERCRGIVTVVSGVAGKQFTDAFPLFTRRKSERTVLADAISLAADEPIDVVIGSVSVENGPEDLALFGGKGNLGAAKTFFVFEGYGGVGGAFALGTKAQMEKIDGIFCNDTFAKALVHKLLPEYPTEHIYSTGSLAVEGFGIPRAEQYRATTREQLGIAPETFAVLYLGDVSADYGTMANSDAQVNLKTFTKTLGGIEEFARSAQDQEVSLIVRPHPRDPEKEQLVQAGNGESIPENMSIKNASSMISMNGAAYASDVIVSIISTENFFAPMRGRRSVFLAYDGPGFGGEALMNTYGPDLIDAIQRMPGVYIAASPTELTQILERMVAEPPLQPRGMGAVTESILDTVLS